MKKIKELYLEDKVWKFIEKNKFFIFFMLITLLSVIIRLKLLEYKSNDYFSCLEPWFNQLREGGGFNALKNEIGNYNPPYMTILAFLTYLPIEPLVSIKIVSIIFDYVCGFTIFEITNNLLKDNKNREKFSLLCYGITIFLPTVFINSSCWAQSDSIYTAFVLLSLMFLMKGKNIKSFVFLGLAFSFKLQTIFILPLFIIMYLSERKFSILNFIIVPIVDFLMCLPAIIFGKPISQCIEIYTGQVKEYSRFITMNFPNIYAIFFKADPSDTANLIESTNELVGTIGIWVTIFIFVVIAMMVLYKKVKFDEKAIIEFGLWGVFIATFFLPQMHDRYLYLGELLGIVYFVCNRKKYYIPLAIELISISSYACAMFSGNALNIGYVAIFYFVIIVLYSKDMYKTYLN